jgi:hypothetical protein
MSQIFQKASIYAYQRRGKRYSFKDDGICIPPHMSIGKVTAKHPPSTLLNPFDAPLHHLKLL